MRAMIVCAALSASACATVQPEWGWAPAAALKSPAADRYPDEDAVYLLRERRVVLVSSWSGRSYTADQRHDVLALLTEDGFEHANVRVYYQEGGAVRDFAARTVAPDGTIAEVTAFNVHDDDAYAEKKLKLRARIFTFPDLKVGSVIEYRYTVENPGTPGALEEYVNAPLPIEKYRLELWGTQDIRYSTKVYHTHQKWVAGEEGKFWTLTWAEDDVAPTISEPWSPARAWRDPYWVFTIQQFAKQGYAYDVNRTWETALQHQAKQLYFDNAEYYAGFDPKLDVAANASPSAVAKAVVEWARDRWAVLDDGARAAKQPKYLLDERQATGAERTRAMWKLLVDRGVKAELALVNPVEQPAADREMPRSGAHEKLIIHVPQQPGIPVPVWIDGQCDFCAFGEVPSWIDGAEATVVRATLGIAAKQPTVTPEWLRVEGPPVQPSRAERNYQVTITSTGSLTMEVKVRSLGSWAAARRNELLTGDPASRRQRLAATLRRRSPGLKVVSRDDPTIDRGVRQALSSYRASSDTHVAAAGRLRVVPLTFLESSDDDLFEDEERKLPIAIHTPATVLDTADITVPPGWKLHDRPASVRHDAAGLSCRIDVEPSGPRSVRVTAQLAFSKVRASVADYPALRAVARACAELRRSAITFEAP